MSEHEMTAAEHEAFRVETLEKIIREARETARAAYVREYRATATLDRIRGEPLSAEFHDALARCWDESTDEASAAKDRAYVRLQASRCMDGNFGGIPPEHLDAVKAEVERLRAENGS